MNYNFVQSDKIIIDIGSGPHPKPDATVLMDVHEWPGVNVKHDLHNLPYPFPDNHADKIYLGDVIEHLVYLAAPLVLKEIHRILKPGTYVEITCPDMLWIMERIVKGDWKEKTEGMDWLNTHEDPWDNAMDYMYGGWRHPEEFKIPGMGHINGFSEQSLTKMLLDAGFDKVERVPDERNPEGGRDAVLKLLAWKN